MTVSGTVFDSNIGQPVSGATVILYAKKVESGTYTSQYSTIESSVTGGDGRFVFVFDEMRVSDYKLSIQKTGYFSQETVINPENVVQGEEYSATYPFYSISWIKFTIRNSFPTHTEDVAFYRLLAGSLEGFQCCNDSTYYFYGNTIDTVKVCKVHGSQKAVVEWLYIYGVNQQTHRDSIYCSPGDTSEYSINY